MTEVKLVTATADVNPPEKRARSDLRRQERASAASPGRSSMPSTATTKRPGRIDIGPGRSNVPRKAVFALEKPLELRRRSAAQVPPGAESRRLEQRRQPEQQPGPLPLRRHCAPPMPRPIRCRPRSARSSKRPPTSGRRRRSPRSSATGGRPCPSGRKRTTRSKQLWQQHPRGHVAVRARRPRRASPDVHPGPRRLPQADDAGGARRARVPASARRARIANAARFRPLAGRWAVADRGPGDRQPRLADVLRHGPRQHERRSRPAGRAAVASGAARLAGRRIHGATVAAGA